ncbi:1-aminocyclopropane-1-carboxylate deaminase/D-cysteine desulfhydrase [Microbulbifer sp. ZKSA004]|uniref:1-aminocyclopropane-1-carboxylate deaminase/D-cysteine desulfhydrase n=1 Tax=Microbulbifer sp. ZKSA004 TaxID=3243389 RepID=UPI0040398779
MFPSVLDKLDVNAFTKVALRVPYQRVNSRFFPGIHVWLRRDDLLDPLISGNKAYKLLFNLIEAKQKGAEAIITCGGAWSNHIHATAAAGARFNVSTVGIIRGERPPVLSSMLRDSERYGMRLAFIAREEYRRRSEPDFLKKISIEKNNSIFIPEGGANIAGVRGGRLLGRVIGESAPVKFDQVWVACGTGSTFAGLASGLSGVSCVGVEVLKAGASVAVSFKKWFELLKGESLDSFEHVSGGVPGGSIGGCRTELLSGFHCGGYGKYPDRLQEFHDSFEGETGIPLDPVYTSKLFFALSECARQEWLRKGSKILLVHSGGLQGRRGF